jgi:hypothetical protein
MDLVRLVRCVVREPLDHRAPLNFQTPRDNNCNLLVGAGCRVGLPCSPELASVAEGRTLDQGQLQSAHSSFQVHQLLAARSVCDRLRRRGQPPSTTGVPDPSRVLEFEERVPERTRGAPGRRAPRAVVGNVRQWRRTRSRHAGEHPAARGLLAAAQLLRLARECCAAAGWPDAAAARRSAHQLVCAAV